MSGQPQVTERVSIDEIREAAAGFGEVVERTPLVHSPGLEELAGVPVYLKLENSHPTGAFKLRGAWTAVRRMSAQQGARGVLTYSSGNHGQAVAYAAKQVGARAVVVMPETAPPIKVDGVKRWGGEVVFAGTTSEDRYAVGLEMAASQGLTVIPPFDHPDVIAGQGTVGLEIVEELPDVAQVAFPVGGGGLGAGVTTAIKALRPEARVTGVEPETSACFNAALLAGEPIRLEGTKSIADGLLPLSVGTVTFQHLVGRADGVTVTDSAIAEATLWLRNVQGVMAEPSGSATTAAVRSGVLRPLGPAVLVVSGGNADQSVIESLEQLIQ